MYRQYEEPSLIENLLKEAKAKYEAAVKAGEDMDRLVSLHEDVVELEERLNFAIQDMEADMEEQ